MKMTHLIAGAALAVASAMSAQAQELKFANFTPPFHTINASVIEKLNADLSAATDGAVSVRGYHGGELGAGPVEQYVRAVQGVADMVWGLPGYTSSQFGKTMIVELPNAIPLDQPGYEALWAAFDEIKGEFPATKPIALWTSEPNIFIMKDVQIRTPADLAGLKVRVAGATAAEVAEALGATPVQMPINQVYNALQTGLIDGVITGASTLSDFKLDEVANSYTVGANLGRLAFYTVMGQSSYDKLSADAKAAVDAVAGMEVSKSAEMAWNATADAALEAARADDTNVVIDLSPEEAQAFADAVADVVNGYVAEVSGEAALAKMRGE
ncbi:MULTISPECIES: TRAP transporter substrate-binding protein [Mameliella]|uniref:ABC transporter substrate-binding protein n=2 Tax=Mameliella TaxID=1434019 RepID=A0A0B3S1X2_9RHOB|nr:MULTISPECIES: TRAP transporter substrate-binding protein [Mameliella]MCR9276003.1 TRAP transporter substrate-binding protein [Paracoccaceae bacterium]MDD9731734.1 TRAP transporter substrate-binding protein [Mameliella sp. AT18]KHQ50651.1 ABC transporter substrate-binding protein [Mameliella alba]MBY6122657.1 TRAP transporter substrate-binding protein [Mameliella alba]OWV40687.1 C4-dicarboxylate ABC transporter substrate-binding protein [Mameliella alba]